MRRLTPLLVLACAGCTATVIPGAPGADASAVTDASAAPDVPPGADVPPGTDAPRPADAPLLADAPGIIDLSGRWRVVRFRFRGMNGDRIEATDEPTPYTDPGTGNTAVLRANGSLRLSRQRFAMSLAMLANDHIRSAGVEMGVDTFSATGIAVPGLLEGASRFAVTGGMAAYALEPIGTQGLRVTFGDGGSVTELVRADAIPGAAQLNVVGAVERLRPETQRPIMNPRVALFWVRPMTRGAVERNGVALRFAGPWAQYPLTLADPPEEPVRFVVGDVPLATAMILVYDDLNNNRVMDLAQGDALRGISNITLVWRGAGDANGAAFRQSAFADLAPGYHFAWRTRDYSTGGVTLLPFDGVRPVSPDAPVSPTELDPTAIESAWR